AMRKTNLWLPLAAGLVGAGVALLFAPRSGKETREQIRHKAENVQSKAKEKVEKGRDKAMHMKDRMADTVQAVKRRGQDNAIETKDSLHRNIGQSWEEK